jgi:hypothetical protein
VADENLMVELSMAELREITGYAVACAQPALAVAAEWESYGGNWTNRCDDWRPTVNCSSSSPALGGDRSPPSDFLHLVAGTADY